MLNESRKINQDFNDHTNTYFHAQSLANFNPPTGSGELVWERHQRKLRLAFNQVSSVFEPTEPWEFPGSAYPKDLQLPFKVSFVSPRTLRLQFATKEHGITGADSLMLTGAVPEDDSWLVKKTDQYVHYHSEFGSVKITFDPWSVAIYDGEEKLLTKSQIMEDTKCLINSRPQPFSIARRSEDFNRRIAANFSLSPNEQIFGCGESFTRLNKRGQLIHLEVDGAHGVQSQEMYKPIPMFLSSAGYGMFVHTSTPVTLDLGHTYDGANVIYTAADTLDLFIFIGSYKDILQEYTALTGRSPMPPLWTFGLWMSRISYNSQAEVDEVSENLREYKIPCDVIHVDTGWFEHDWLCDFEFSKTRFPDPAAMIANLHEQGFKISLWQLPYFTPTNKLFAEIVKEGYAVKDPEGNLPTQDAILDFSNPEAVSWYQGKLERLLKLGVDAIKVDFGEAAPYHGQYASGKSGLSEHNLYPLRYNQVVADITKEVHGNGFIWARSAWAGSQRYPTHWGGDAENTNSAMASTLRAGLSLGLSGFSFWSHDIGGFTRQAPRELYRRWLPFGMLTSHSRCHGAPPKEPWAYDQEFVDEFRRAVELKYKLLPYIYTQAKLCSENGYPMLRPLFFEFPQDNTAHHIEDQYMFGEDILVAPFITDDSTRTVYLPEGKWIDYQTEKVYQGGQWYELGEEKIPIVIMVRDSSVIPHIALAQSTKFLDWSQIEYKIYATTSATVSGKIYRPGDQQINKFSLDPKDGKISFHSGT